MIAGLVKLWLSLQPTKTDRNLHLLATLFQVMICLEHLSLMYYWCMYSVINMPIDMIEGNYAFCSCVSLCTYQMSAMIIAAIMNNPTTATQSPITNGFRSERVKNVQYYKWKRLSIHIPPVFPQWTSLLPQSRFVIQTHRKNYITLWHWPLTYNLDLQSQPS